MLIKFLENQDHFSFNFTISFLGKKETHTYIGMICSLALNIGCIVMFTLYLIELFNHSKPNVNYSRINKQKTTNMTLNTRELLYTVGFRDKYYQIITDPSIASVVPIYERMHTNEEGKFIQEQIELDIVNCSNYIELFRELGVEYQYNSNGVKDYFCFNGTTYGEPIILGGKYGSEFYGDLAITVKKCIDSDENAAKGIKCKPEAEVNEAVQDAWIQITYASAFIDSDNYTQPIQYILDGYYTRLDHSVNKMLYTYFNLVNFYSENNIIFDNEKHYKAIKEDYESTDINLQNEDGTIFTAYVCPSFTVENYKRSYIKIQEIGANVGGLYRCIFIVIFILISLYQKEFFNLKIMNFILKTNPNINNRILKSDINQSINPIQMVSDKNMFPKPEKKVRPLTLSQVFKSKYCCCQNRYSQKKKEILYINSKQKKYTDYSEVIKLLIGIEKNTNNSTLNLGLLKSEKTLDCGSKDIMNISEGRFFKKSLIVSKGELLKGNSFHTSNKKIT